MPLKAPPDQDIVIVGATGDLAQRKLIPALYNLQAQQLLPAECSIIGAAPFDWNDQRFRDLAESSVKQFSRTPLQKTAFNAFASRLRFVPLPADGNLTAIRPAATQDRRLAYLAVPPSAFTSLIDGIKTAGLAGGTSIIIEKPFGHDLTSAEDLNRALHDVVPEQRIFRIDHYMGKETVQNLLIFRFGNSLFERIWSRDAISRVEITVAESLGVEQRGKLYEEIGAIRDIVQNHMFQVLALVAMDPPLSFDAEAIRNEKVKVLQSIQPIHPHDVVRGQYTAGTIDGDSVAAYRDEPGVSKTSTTETYAALRLHLESWRWSGVPFLLRTGKRLPTRDTRVVITFHDVPLHLFKTAGVHTLHRNRLVVRIQPDEGIALSFVAKQPGPEVTAQSVDMNFNYGDSFKTSPPEAYERLLHDALEGDHTLFIREDEVEHGWAAIEPVIESPPPVTFYPAGTWGPDDAARIASPSHWDDSVAVV
jgi:glucose-6-phosphate 1-dehydrogenase